MISIVKFDTPIPSLLDPLILWTISTLKIDAPVYFSVWEIPTSWSARAIPYFESNLMIDAHDPDSAIYGSYIPRGPVPE